MFRVNSGSKCGGCTVFGRGIAGIAPVDEWDGFSKSASEIRKPIEPIGRRYLLLGTLSKWAAAPGFF